MPSAELKIVSGALVLPDEIVEGNIYVSEGKIYSFALS